MAFSLVHMNKYIAKYLDGIWMKTWFFKYQVRNKTVCYGIFLQSPPAYHWYDQHPQPSRSWASVKLKEEDTRYSGGFVPKNFWNAIIEKLSNTK